MKIDLQAIEKLAPDQASLKAAADLARADKWSAVGASPDGRLIWGACAGSGANPYRVMADLDNLGSKCSCPSRKFPCKHALALLWLRAEERLTFAPTAIPDAVSDWLARRRKPVSSAAPDADALSVQKDLGAALAGQNEATEDPKAAARRATAVDKRAADTHAVVIDALNALEQWIGDQLRLGLSSFIDDATARCRKIAARLVDGKASVLAGRLDELPARVLALASGDRPRGAVVELGKLVLLARAYRAAPNDPEIKRAVISAETRESVLQDPRSLRIAAAWEVLGEKIETRRDRLVSQTTWLLNLGAAGPRFAMLLDYFPASAGRRAAAFTAGEQFEAELAFYPAGSPLRGLLISRSAPVAGTAPLEWPDAPPTTDLRATLAARLADEPWMQEMPMLLPSGRIALDGAGNPWWHARSGNVAFRAADVPAGIVQGTDLEQLAAIWGTNGLSLLAARTKWGRVDCVG